MNNKKISNIMWNTIGMKIQSKVASISDDVHSVISDNMCMSISEIMDQIDILSIKENINKLTD
jgi:hypothetical protein